MNQPPNIDDKRFNDLLEHWSGGDFNRTDETELDALGEMDDFRKEALAGYRAVPEADHSARLQAMRARLQAQTGTPEATGGKRIMLPWVWAAAAALVLLIVAVLFFAPPQPTATLADQSVAYERQTDLPAGSADMLVPDASASDAYFKPSPKTSKSAAPTQGKQTQPAGPPNARALSVPVEDAFSAEEIVVTPSETVGTISAPVSAPTPMAELPPKPNAAKPYKEEAAKKAPSGASAEAVKHDTESRADLDRLRKDARAEGELSATAEPSEGWERFREYLRQNARLTTEARNQNVSGTVRLQFAVLSDGTPTNFSVVRRLGYGCDEEAIRLIKDWEWIPGKYNFLTIDIAFNR